MPSGTVEHENGMRAFENGLRDFDEMSVNRLLKNSASTRI